MTELDKLEQYLKDNNIPYDREDRDAIYDNNGYEVLREFHQICVPSAYAAKRSVPGSWDAVCHKGSYGYELGLLEIYGSLVDEKKDGDSVAGWLTAEDVITRIERRSNGQGITGGCEETL